MHAFAHEVSTQIPSLFSVFVGERAVGVMRSTAAEAAWDRELGLDQRAWGRVGRHEVHVRARYIGPGGVSVWLPV